MKDYEIFIGPFSAHAYSRYEVFNLVIVARKLNLLSEEEAEIAAKVAADVIAGGNEMRSVTKFSIHDRERENHIRKEVTHGSTSMV